MSQPRQPCSTLAACCTQPLQLSNNAPSLEFGLAGLPLPCFPPQIALEYRGLPKINSGNLTTVALPSSSTLLLKFLRNCKRSSREPMMPKHNSDSVEALSPPDKRARVTTLTANIDDDRVCDRCSKFDFEAIFNPSNETPIIELHIAAEMESSECPLCQLFDVVYGSSRRSVWSSQLTDPKYHLRCWTTLEIYGLRAEARMTSKLSVIVTVEQGNNAMNDLLYGEGWMPYGAIVLVISDNSQPINQSTFSGLLVDSTAVDFSRVRTWLTHCEARHTEVCEAQVTSLPLSMKVIDCGEMPVVPVTKLPSNTQYFALSYVWGSPNSDSNTYDAASPYTIPVLYSAFSQVVKDAIEVVKNLREEGTRYLWVDKYCIDQNNAEDKYQQIRRMDSIYEGAVATIIAASGDGSECGLPGVGSVPRLAQPAAFVNGKQLVSTLPHVSVALEHTTWATRGWTYQEAMLSRRCIVFTDLQVYFICRKSTCCEAINKHDDLAASGDELPSALLKPRPQIAKQLQTDDDFILFSDHVKNSTQRKLTCETDALDALRGVLGRLPFRSYWGIPFVHLANKDAPYVGFAKGLAWRALFPMDLKPITRREKFPSWSWTGWTGPIGYEPNGPSDSFLEGMAGPTIFDITFWAELPGNDRRLVSLQMLQDTAGSAKVIEEISPIIHVEAYIVKPRFKRLESKHQSQSGIHSLFCKTHAAHPETECESSLTRCSGRGVDLYVKDNSDERVFCQPWEGILLTSGIAKKTVDVLIIEWHGSTARRVGILHTVQKDVIMSLQKVSTKNSTGTRSCSSASRRSASHEHVKPLP